MIDAIIYKTAVLARSALAVSWITGNALNPALSAPAPLQDLNKVVENLVVAVFALGGLACFAMFITGGLSYLSAGGDDKAIKKAKDTLTYAVAGLFLVIGAYALLKTLFGVNVLNFGDIQFILP